MKRPSSFSDHFQIKLLYIHGEKCINLASIVFNTLIIYFLSAIGI